MRAGECGKHQLAGIRLAGRHLHLGAALIHFLDCIDVVEIQLRIYPLGPHIQRQGHNIHIAGTLAVAEQGALYTIGTGHQRQLRSSHALAPVIVGVQGDNGRVPVGQVTAKILDLVCITVGRGAFHSGGQVQDNGVLLGNMQLLHHPTADLYRIVHLRTGKGLWRILKANVHLRVALFLLLGECIDQASAVHGDLNHAVHIRLKHHLALQSGSGIVKMHDHILGAVNGLKGLFDQVRARLHQHLNGHIVRDIMAVDQSAQDLILRLAGRGKAHLDLLKPNRNQGLKIFQLFLQIHRVHQRLVAVTQIHRAPNGRMVDHAVGPLAVRQINGGKGLILLVALVHHHSFSFLCWGGTNKNCAPNG